MHNFTKKTPQNHVKMGPSWRPSLFSESFWCIWKGFLDCWSFDKDTLPVRLLTSPQPLHLYHLISTVRFSEVDRFRWEEAMCTSPVFARPRLQFFTTTIVQHPLTRYVGGTIYLASDWVLGLGWWKSVIGMNTVWCWSWSLWHHRTMCSGLRCCQMTW